jgi:dihydrofolate synthase/folylpolyglutamate synthase
MSVEPAAAAIAAWLEESVNFERTGAFREIRLDRIRQFLTRLPPPPPPCTVAGTKGKGSTVRLIEAALRAHGRPTLAFTSPHVASVLERWRLDGAVADPATVAALCDQVAALERRHDVRLTYFERTFAVACLLAAQRPGTCFLCEVGLGGRLDCANALDCAMAVITHLSHDHRDILGPTLHHIAREKLAVVRPGAPLVVAPQTPAGTRAIRDELAALAVGDVDWVSRPPVPVALALLGDHQQDNAATALAAARRLLGADFSGEIARRGMAQARLAARCQVVDWRGRRLLVDGAHNQPSIAAALAVAGAQLRPGWRLLIGLATDKEMDEILAVIPAGLPVGRVGYRSSRARGRADWPARALAWPWFDDVAAALAAQPPGTDLCITGSFYLAGEALRHGGAQGLIPG